MHLHFKTGVCNSTVIIFVIILVLILLIIFILLYTNTRLSFVFFAHSLARSRALSLSLARALSLVFWQLCGYSFAFKHLDKRQVIVSSAKGAVTQVYIKQTHTH
jgi:hypothetical protein